MRKPARIACVVLSMVAILVATAAISSAQTQLPTQAACRVKVADRDGATSCGSGTLVDVAADGSAGLVITNAHVVRDRASDECLVIFPDGRRHGARIKQIDERIDAAALIIANPARQAAPWTDELEGERFCGVGFGPAPADRLQATPGQVIADYGSSGGQHSISLNAPFRDGDSGGGLFDEQGRLCGLIWGSTGNEGFCVHPTQVAAFIVANGGVRQQQFTQQQPPPCYIDASGRKICPLLQPRAPASRIAPPAAAPLAASPPRANPTQGCDCRTTIASLEARIKELESRPPEQGPPGERGPAGPVGPAGQAAVFDRQAAAVDLAATLPPINVEQRDYYTGELLDSGKVNLGGTLVLRYGVKGAAAPGVNDARPQ